MTLKNAHTVTVFLYTSTLIMGNFSLGNFQEPGCDFYLIYSLSSTENTGKHTGISHWSYT